MIKHEEARILYEHMMYCSKKGLTSHGVIGESCIIKDKKPQLRGLDDFAKLESYFTQQEKVSKLYQLEKQARLQLVECIDNPNNQQLKSDYFLTLFEIDKLEAELK